MLILHFLPTAYHSHEIHKANLRSSSESCFSHFDRTVNYVNDCVTSLELSDDFNKPCKDFVRILVLKAMCTAIIGTPIRFTQQVTEAVFYTQILELVCSP